MAWNLIDQLWNWVVIGWGWIKANGPALSPAVVAVSVSIAYFSLLTQRDLARKRAAIDFFLKTEIDQHSLLLWDAFRSALQALADASSYEEFQNQNHKENGQIERYLNIFELVACGVKGKILDEGICKSYWRTIILDTYDKTDKMLRYIQSKANAEENFQQFKWLAQRWQVRK